MPDVVAEIPFDFPDVRTHVVAKELADGTRLVEATCTLGWSLTLKSYPFDLTTLSITYLETGATTSYDWVRVADRLRPIMIDYRAHTLKWAVDDVVSQWRRCS